MQIVSCDVFLSGDRNHMVSKPEITVAEVVVLQHIHGMDAVVNIKPVRMDRRPHAQERERLRKIYNRGKTKIVDQLYPNRPGAKLPVDLGELDVSMAGADQETAPDEQPIVPPAATAPAIEEAGNAADVLE